MRPEVALKTLNLKTFLYPHDIDRLTALLSRHRADIRLEALGISLCDGNEGLSRLLQKAYQGQVPSLRALRIYGEIGFGMITSAVPLSTFIGDDTQNRSMQELTVPFYDDAALLFAKLERDTTLKRLDLRGRGLGGTGTKTMLV